MIIDNNSCNILSHIITAVPCNPNILPSNYIVVFALGHILSLIIEEYNIINIKKNWIKIEYRKHTEY